MNSQHAAVHRFTHHCIPGAQNSVWHLVDSHQTFAEGMTETDVVSAIMESTVQVEKQLNMQRGYRQGIDKRGPSAGPSSVTNLL